MMELQHFSNGRSSNECIWSSNWCVNCYGSCSIWTAWQGTCKSTRRI